MLWGLAASGLDAPRSSPHERGTDAPPGPARATTANKTRLVSAGFAVPTQTLQKHERFLRRAPPAPTPPAVCTSRVMVAAREERKQNDPAGQPATGAPLRRPRASGPSTRPAPPCSAPLPTNATRRALRSSGEPRNGRVGGGARRSRRPSRACRSHVVARVTCSRRSQSRRTLSGSKEAVVRDRPRPEMFSSLAPAASGALAAATETPAAAAARRSSFRG